MERGLEISFKVLARTGNEAAVDVLVSALDSPNRSIQDGALRALLARPGAAGRRELVHRWKSFDEHSKSVLAERGGRMSGVLRDAILNAEVGMCSMACEAAMWLCEYDLIPVLINAAEDKADARADLTGRTLVNLAERLYQELASLRDHRDHRDRRDPKLVRQHVIASLELSVGRFEQHQRREVLEAFLLLAEHDNATLKTVLQGPPASSYPTVLDLLLHSHRPGIMRLVVDYLSSPRAPAAVINVLSRRGDAPFVKRFMRKFLQDSSHTVQNNLKRLESARWATGDRQVLLELNEDEQRAAVGVAAASGMKRLEVFEIFRFLLSHGNVGGRRAAIAALSEHHGSAANQAVLDCLRDGDCQVQAAALAQLRKRGIPGAMSLLIERIDHPAPEVQRAVRDSLNEFNCGRYLAAFDMMDHNLRRNTGLLVKKIDPAATSLLREELAASPRTRRLRAIQAAAAIGVVPEVAEQILGLISDPDQVVRAEAARSLRQYDAPQTRQALREALLDRSVAVQEAAEESLRSLADSAAAAPAAASPADVPATIDWMDKNLLMDEPLAADNERAM